MNGLRLRVRNLHKSFSHVKALRGVNLTIEPGRIMALVGDNGAGKSTLVKIMAGVLPPDKGEIIIDNRVYRRLTPNQAIEEGIATVYQDLALVNCRDVASNIFLGRELTRGFFVNKSRMYRQAQDLLERLDIDVPAVKIPVGQLSGGQRQAIAIARAVNMGGRLFIFDEPTAALGYKETNQTLRLIRQLREQGYSVIVISHNLHHVFSIADDICVLRHGRVVDCLPTSRTRQEQVVKLITGMEIA
ncbi:MAG: sugar ABC transporter ATP-binding protein [Syntrophothermus sp.]|uniref:ATP-binding cassette domain-containing protein n=1 Tax=Syntrophothermus sp. TaxID=2736299 RepID=UPI0025809AEA|nr:ATP-binding cassette domain-containing protein [Syntrophothermus sp.]NSW83301.1 sugar ABC transporter ATP-binding protein [Syntrophothermus sp.]